MLVCLVKPVRGKSRLIGGQCSNLDTSRNIVWCEAYVAKSAACLPCCDAMTPLFRYAPPPLVGIACASGGTPRISRAAWEAADRATLTWFARNVPSDIAVLRPSDALCSRQWCSLAREGRSLYFDANHLTMFGARWVTREFWQIPTNTLSRSGKNM